MMKAFEVFFFRLDFCALHTINIKLRRGSIQHAAVDNSMVGYSLFLMRD